MRGAVKHTPGPWQNSHRNGVPVVQGAATECVAVIPAPGVDGFGVTKSSEREANARLIAAAPDLLRELKTAHEHLEHMAKFISDRNLGYSFEALGEDIGNIRAAVARAEGR